jgi:hypothetical protein
MAVDVLNICDFKCENITILSLLYVDYEHQMYAFWYTIQEFRLYLKENTIRHHYKHQLVNAV